MIVETREIKDRKSEEELINLLAKIIAVPYGEEFLTKIKKTFSFVIEKKLGESLKDCLNVAIQTVEKRGMSPNINGIEIVEDFINRKSWMKTEEIPEKSPAEIFKENNFHKIIKVEALENYILKIEFEEGVIKEYDCNKKLSEPLYSSLKDKEKFSKVRVEADGYAISWNKKQYLADDELWEG